MLSEVVTCNCVRNPGGTRNRTRDLPKKGSAFILSSDHWTLRLCRLLSRVLLCPALEPKLQSATCAQAKTALQRRSAELRHAYATHMQIERMAALAIATPRSPLLDTVFSTPSSHPASPPRSCHHTPGDTKPPSPGPSGSSLPSTPLSPGTPAYLAKPFAHAEVTLGLLGYPAGGARTSGAAAAAEAATLLAHVTEDQAIESLGTLGRSACRPRILKGRCPPPPPTCMPCATGCNGPCTAASCSLL